MRLRLSLSFADHTLPDWTLCCLACLEQSNIYFLLPSLFRTARCFSTSTLRDCFARFQKLHIDQRQPLETTTNEYARRCQSKFQKLQKQLVLSLFYRSWILIATDLSLGYQYVSAVAASTFRTKWR